jgi:hypothetical protein
MCKKRLKNKFYVMKIKRSIKYVKKGMDISKCIRKRNIKKIRIDI